MTRIQGSSLLLILCLLSWQASYALPMSNATFVYPNAGGIDPSKPGIGVRDNLPSLIGQIEGYALGGGSPSVRVALNILNADGFGISPVLGNSTVDWFMRMAPLGTDPFGTLTSVPMTMDYFASLNAAPQQNSKVVGDAIISITNRDAGFQVTTLKDFRSCASTEFTGDVRCFGSHPTRPSVLDQGTVKFDLVTGNLYEMGIHAHIALLCADFPCEGFGSTLIDPFPQIDSNANPLLYGRPLGFRFQDHYQLEFSPNLITAVPLPAPWALLMGGLALISRRGIACSLPTTWLRSISAARSWMLNASDRFSRVSARSIGSWFSVA